MKTLLAVIVLASFNLCARQAPADSDLLDLARLKDFSARRVSSNNADPASNDDSKRPIPGETLVLADLKGPGVITHIWLTIAANEYGWPRLLRFRVYYDGSTTASVDAPVGDFFGVGHGQERPVNSVMVRNASSGRARNSYWPMPFRKGCRITITNEGRHRVSNLYYHVDWKKVATLPADIGYFHAYYRQKLPAVAGKPYEVLNITGRGHYVGTVLSVVQAAPGGPPPSGQCAADRGGRRAGRDENGRRDGSCRQGCILVARSAGFPRQRCRFEDRHSFRCPAERQVRNCRSTGAQL